MMRDLLRIAPCLLPVHPPVPPYLIHFLTNRCNASCKHCFVVNEGTKGVVDERYRGDELKLDEIRQVAARSNGKLVHVNLTGGELFLREDVSEIVEAYAMQGGARSVGLLTNGYFTDRLAATVERTLARDRPTLIVGVSLDAIGAEHDEFRRCKGLFKKASESIHFLKSVKSSRFSWNINLTVTKYNYDRLQTIYDGFRELFGRVNISCGLVRDDGSDHRLVEAYDRFCRTLRAEQVQVYTRGVGTVMGLDIVAARNRLLQEETARVARGGRFLAPCVAGRLTCVVYANGDVYPCEVLPRQLGNLRLSQYDLAQIWARESTKLVAKGIRRSRCSCAHGCFLGMTILFAPGYYPRLLGACVRHAVRG